MPNAKGSDDTRDASRLTLLLRQENTLARLFKNHVGGFLAAASGGYLPPQYQSISLPLTLNRGYLIFKFKGTSSLKFNKTFFSG
jgi:hypothetical protein